MALIGMVAEQRDALRAFAKKHGLRGDWHEPDEQGVSARVVGSKLDNAFGSEIAPAGSPMSEFQEFVVILKQEDGEELKINLANLLSMACSK